MALAALAAVSCSRGMTEPAADGSAAQVVSVGDTVQLKYGESAAIRQTAVRVQFSRVVADSRCPIDVVCVWAGDAHVRLTVTSASASASRTYDLHTYSDPKFADHDQYRLSLVEVGPSRRSDTTIRLQDYYVKLEITQK